MANLRETRTRKRGINRIYPHSDRITYSDQGMSLNSLIPGQICTFSYRVTNPQNYDNKPLILFLYKDRITKLIHGINLHYLTERDVQALFNKIAKFTSINFGQSKNFSEHHVRVDLSERKGSKIPSPIQFPY